MLVASPGAEIFALLEPVPVDVTNELPLPDCAGDVVVMVCFLVDSRRTEAPVKTPVEELNCPTAEEPKSTLLDVVLEPPSESVTTLLVLLNDTGFVVVESA